MEIINRRKENFNKNFPFFLDYDILLLGGFDMKKIIRLIVVILTLFLCCSCSNKTNKIDLLGIDFEKSGNEISLEKYKTENPLVAMDIEGYGAIVI